ncbi:PREDICTED: protein SIEVE ELEMENT OCCLUSION B-like [Ipomoea nil]|uniref:protein SIEVE ELEMENT OCCLUSION B-like n=1 Tax=Ipomoea nil TaxID=35883 RepID=UPI0009008FFF|nr:PREDICTED: protein SIEVE ELEMENT OCCLUSION B-like [Ipomoea nil]
MREHNNRPVGLHLFQGQGVLLLISSGKHFPFYAYYYASERVKMIWVPITNDLEEEHIQMPDRKFNYYCVLDPQKWIAPEFIRFLRDECFPTFQVGGDPIAISLDNRGRLVHSNALHMIFTWGFQLTNEITMRSGDIIPSLETELRERTSDADRVIGDIDEQTQEFVREVRKKINDWVEDIMTKTRSSYRSYNYTSEREQALWGKESWNLKLVSKNYTKLKRWIDDENYIFLCGGNNNKQVQEFTRKLEEVRSKIQVNIKIAYIGRSGKNVNKVRSVCDYAFNSRTDKFFWIRLRMASSRIQYLSKAGLDEENDEIMQGLKKLLAYEAEGSAVGVWALLSKGNRIIACDMGEKIYGVMNEYEKWEDNTQENGFDKAFKDCYETMLSSSSLTLTQHPCCSLNYPSNLDEISETVSCPQCNHNMQKFVTFSCCHGSTTSLHNFNMMN